MEKIFLRKEMLNKRKLLSSVEVNIFSEIICQQLTKVFLSTNNNYIIAGYYPINNEVNIINFLTLMQQNNNIIVLPRIIDNQTMIFKKYQNLQNLTNDGFNKAIFQPNRNAKTLIPQIVIIPLLAIDLEGNRIGYGKAYYDKIINEIKKQNNIKIIAVCYDFQIVQHIDHHPHDQQCDLIISEKRMINVNKITF